MKKVCGNINFEEYFSTDIDNMDFEDAYKKDQRKFLECYCDRAQENQIILNTFYSQDNFNPLSIRVLFLLLNLDLDFVVNGIFFGEDYISERYHDTNEEKYFSFLPRTLERFLYCRLIGGIILSIGTSLFVEEKRIKGILEREKDNELKLKSEIIIIIKKSKKKHIIFICLCCIISIISWYHISCFNSVYPNTKTEWIKSSIAVILAEQLLTVFMVLLEVIFRFISYKCKSEKIFKVSKFFADVG